MKKKLFCLLLCVLICESLFEQKIIERKPYKLPTTWELFVDALIFVESRGNENAVGDKNDVGILQITPIYVKEVNRILGETVYYLEDRYDKEKSLEMFEIIQTYRNPQRDINKAIKLHNPRAGKQYAYKIKEQMDILRTKINI